MKQANWTQRLQLIRILSLINVVAMGWMGYKVVEPYVNGTSAAKVEEAKLSFPQLNYAQWEALPVLESGRVKPMQTVATETVRQVTGRAKMDDQSAMAILLSWIFYDPAQPGAIDWENYPFILCEDRELRAKIYGVDQNDPAAYDQVHGKRIAPARLRRSEDFKRLIVQVEKKRREDEEKYEQQLDPLEKKAKRVKERLDAYEWVAAGLLGEDAYKRDPIHYVALDKVPDAPWFSIAELRYLTAVGTEHSDQLWGALRSQRVLTNPRPYLSDEVKKELIDFQQAIKDKTVEQKIAELAGIQDQRTDETIKKSLDSLSNEELIKMLQARTGKSEQNLTAERRAEIREGVKHGMQQQNKQVINDLRARIKAIGKPYIADDPRYNQMYMDYLEARFPNMYNDAVKSQPFPAESAKRALASFDAVAAAYRSGDAAQFDYASQYFFKTIADISNQFTSGHYPGVDTIDTEMTLNQVEPFKWAWISMLLATILFAFALQLESKWAYVLGFVPFFISLGFQLFAYYCRCSISGRPPVSNMYETVVFVSSMAAVFALILEGFYRSKIIILSGSLIATLGLIMADQLPVGHGFDSKISPLVPVLRSNYWLIIHVMTIVASYAAGALAWTIGNISLIMYWFNSDRKDLLRMMANFCYAAIKFAVLLLGVGTFLGGIWAAESWGRFWGWDPKETWAFIALVIYIIPLHARYIGWVRDFGMAVASVVCFSAIVMSWYGVNFVLAAGLHSYGMGDGGPWLIFLLGSVNLLWVLLVCHRRASTELAAEAAD